MDTVTFDGVEYLKASAAAKQFRYTSDYIGQLCRGRKIDARLVGRTWFVNPESIKDHKRSRHQKTLPNSRPAEVANAVKEEAFTKISRKPEIPVRFNRVALKQSENGERNQRRLRVSYEPDEENLIPTLHRKQQRPPKTILIEHVDAKKVAITAKKDVATFQAEELPEVSLSGAIKVTDYPDPANKPAEYEKQHLDTDDTQHNYIYNDISAAQKTDKKPEPSVYKQKDSESVGLKVVVHSTGEKKGIPAKREVKILTSSSVKDVINEGDNAYAVPHSFTPLSIVQKPVREVSTIVLVSPLIATLVAAFFVLFIMLASTSVTVTQSAYESHLVLQVANLLELFNHH